MSLHHTTNAADGTRLAFRVRGEGPTALVFTNGYTTTAAYFRDLIERFQSRAKIVTWDLKGHGDSAPARSLDAVGIEDCVDDLRRVMDAAGVQRATLLGFSMGCQIVLEAWRHIPERIEALVPMLGMAGRPFDNLVHPKVGPTLYRFLRAARPASRLTMRAAWLGTRLPMTHAVNQLSGMIGRSVTREQMAEFYDHFRQIHGPTWAAMGVAAQRHSAEDLLGTITVPTLVVSGGRDMFTPARLGLSMGERIPGARQLHLPDATHAGLFEHAEAIGDALESFLTEQGLLGAEQTRITS